MEQHWQAQRLPSDPTCRRLRQLPRLPRASHTYLSAPSELELQRNLAAPAGWHGVKETATAICSVETLR